MEDCVEELISGFCKTQNETRRVFCVYEQREGRKVLTESDCLFDACAHFKSCALMQEARKLESASDGE